MKYLIQERSHTDRINSKEINGTMDFIVGDTVIFMPNGLPFRVENNKMLRWMQDSKLYVKEVL